MQTKLIMDSASDLQHFPGMNYTCVPLTIRAGEKEFVDDHNLNLDDMIHFLHEHKGKSSTACPGVGAYLEAFDESEQVYCITITSQLSGSYNAAHVAARTYEEQHPGRRVHVFDSLSTGPEMILLAERIRDLLAEKLSFEHVISTIESYQQKTKLIFSLESMRNLANNGRVPFPVAAVTGMLGIRLIGKASAEGRLEMIGKARGEKKLIAELVRHIREMGYSGGKMIIHHCLNPQAATLLANAVKEAFHDACVRIGGMGGLDGFYAERGGLIIGFEA